IVSTGRSTAASFRPSTAPILSTLSAASNTERGPSGCGAYTSPCSISVSIARLLEDRKGGQRRRARRILLRRRAQRAEHLQRVVHFVGNDDEAVAARDPAPRQAHRRA